MSSDKGEKQEMPRLFVLWRQILGNQEGTEKEEKQR